jgi:hypothetical protein
LNWSVSESFLTVTSLPAALAAIAIPTGNQIAERMAVPLCLRPSRVR